QIHKVMHHFTYVLLFLGLMATTDAQHQTDTPSENPVEWPASVVLNHDFAALRSYVAREYTPYYKKMVFASLDYIEARLKSPEPDQPDGPLIDDITSGGRVIQRGKSRLILGFVFVPDQPLSLFDTGKAAGKQSGNVMYQNGTLVAELHFLKKEEKIRLKKFTVGRGRVLYTAGGN
ncbi:MAG: hypothetical protein AAFV07_21180, partial [Bacteroidota bacterium]